MRIVIVLVLVLAALIAATPPSIAADPRASGSCVTCLGPQTNTLWEGYVPLAGFTRYGKPLTKSLRQEVLFIDNKDESSGGSPLFWPLVKALDAFGSWKGVQPAKQPCFALTTGSACATPSFDLSHASYRSRYATIVTAYTAHGAHCVQRLPPEAVALLKHKHWKFGKVKPEDEKCWNNPPAIAGTPSATPTPLLLAGGYLQMGLQVVTLGDLEGPDPGASVGPSGSGTAVGTGLPFATVHDTLAQNQPTSKVPPATLYDINAEANLIEALICHGDKSQPKKVCGRTVIKKLLKRIH